MEKVYIIVRGNEYEFEGIKTVFSNEDDAKKYLELECNAYDYEIIEMDLNPVSYKDIEIVEKLHYKVLIYKIKDEIFTFGDGFYFTERYAETKAPKDRTIIYSKPKVKGDFKEIGWIDVWVDSVEEAHEKIKELKNQVKAR